jgi:general secretion pathway protein G
MLLVVVVIATISYFLFPAFMSSYQRYQAGRTQLTIARISEAISKYTMDIGHPPTAQEGGLRALIRRPSKRIVPEGWNGPYLIGEEHVPRDSWNNEFIYNAPPRKFKAIFSEFEIFSYGKSGNVVPKNLRSGA